MNIIAVDFDGTLCRHVYPDIGEPNLPLIALVKELRAKGAEIILWTCREGKSLSEAVAWCAAHGLAFDAVNENAPGAKNKVGEIATRKIYAEIYIDDRAVHPDAILAGIMKGPT